MPLMIKYVKPHYKVLYHETVTAGASIEKEVTFEDAYTIKRIFAYELTSGDLTGLLTTMRFEDEVIMHDEAPLEIFSQENRYNPEINLAVQNGNTMTIAVKNTTSSDKKVMIVAEIYK